MAKKPINLNYTVSQENMRRAVDQAELKAVITSTAFKSKLQTRGFNFEAALDDKALYAEELKNSISKSAMITTVLQILFSPTWLLKWLYFAPAQLDDTATILFSSGSESVPKGIELSHKNLLANIKQVSDPINFRKGDVVLNSLPIFHSFGLTITTLMPLSEGILMIAIPDLADALAVGKMCAQYNASILLVTSTFFCLCIKYKKLHPLMLQSVRLAVAGAEKLKDDVKNGFRIKFGIEIYEGYGTTETAPVVCVNMPNSLEFGTFKPLVFHKDGTLVKIVDPATLAELPVGEDGLILIDGSQVMKGYYKNEGKTREAIAQIGEWRYYKSGDKGHLDEDGFITIVDRYSRFAKIGGEMISLSTVESLIAALFAEIDPIAVALSDEKKGEKVVVLFVGETSAEEFA
ncbi:hypothetical protein AGMMS50229_08200 [Campylobacterota bacterium]|nr:hypothetical protein AGMMS50229_08200 [Campylobacterota bacterium]